jgi:F-box/leucine-rich repeat protein 13
MLPEDPWEFAVDKLTTLISSRPVSIEWDMFIDTDMKPKRHLFFRNIMDSLMDWDENSQPSPEMYERAFSYRKQKLFHLCFFAWLEFHYCAKRKIERRRAQIEVATAHCRLRTLRVHIKEWKIFSVQMAKRREQATTLLKCVANVVVLRLVFKSWLDCSKASSQSKKWFRV